MQRKKLLVTGENMHLTSTTAHAVSSCVVRLSHIMQKDLGIRGQLSRAPHADKLRYFFPAGVTQITFGKVDVGDSGPDPGVPPNDFLASLFISRSALISDTRLACIIFKVTEITDFFCKLRGFLLVMSPDPEKIS